MRVFRVSHRSSDRATQHKTLILLIASGVADDDTFVTHPPPFSLSHMQRLLGTSSKASTALLQSLGKGRLRTKTEIISDFSRLFPVQQIANMERRPHANAHENLALVHVQSTFGPCHGDRDKNRFRSS